MYDLTAMYLKWLVVALVIVLALAGAAGMVSGQAEPDGPDPLTSALPWPIFDKRAAYGAWPPLDHSVYLPLVGSCR